MSSNINFYINLQKFQVTPKVKQKTRDLGKQGYKVRILSTASDYKDYTKYVSNHETELPDENLYLQNGLGKIVGETIVVISPGHKIVASLGPNRIEEEGERKRGRMGYFAVLSKYRNRGIGTILWTYGLKRLKTAGADFVKCSVAVANTPAQNVYAVAGMKMFDGHSSRPPPRTF